MKLPVTVQAELHDRTLEAIDASVSGAARQIVVGLLVVGFGLLLVAGGLQAVKVIRSHEVRT